MRVDRKTAEKNRAKVVRTAASQFRKHGYDGIGIAGLMKAAGMTQGGFYKQFENKEALECEATTCALQDNFEMWRDVIADKDDPIATLKAWYLSAEHLSNVEQGCTYATLGAEATRGRAPLQKVYSEAVERQVVELSTALGDSENSREQAIKAMAQLIGSLVLARAVDDETLQQEIFSAGKI